nr:hypothetical protein [Tanacetum cinerariifolium]
MIELPKSQPKRTYNKELECEIVMVKMPKCMAWLDDEPIADLDTMEDKAKNPSPQSTPRVLPSFEIYTLPEITNGNMRAGIFEENTKFFFTGPGDGVRINPDGVAKLYLMKRSLEVLRKFPLDDSWRTI